MPRPQILPNMDVLLRWHQEEGLTHAQIAERVREQTGQHVTRAAVSVAMHRYGATEPKERYEEEIPWSLQGRDLKAYPVRMLRLLARKRRGLPMSVDEAARLERWLTKMDDEGAVVAHDPDQNPSVFYVKRREGDDPDIPVRRGRVRVKGLKPVQ